MNKILLIFIFINFSLSLCAQMIKGVSLVGPFDSNLNTETSKQLKSLNANWVAIVPESKINRQTLAIKREIHDSTWTQTDSAYISLIRKLKSEGFQVVLKPHVVLDSNKSKNDKVESSSTWRGDIKMNSEIDWEVLENAYSEFIIHYARIANDHDVDLLIIGTELRSFVKARPQFWFELITQVRLIFKGAISYSANWDNYMDMPFWDQLNLISVNGYFPIASSAEPNVVAVKSKWRPIIKSLERFSKRKKRKVLISEFGYRNRIYAGAKPWLHISETGQVKQSDKAQSNLYKAFFETIWSEDFILGGLIWNWEQVENQIPNTDFSIRNKPVESLVRDYFARG